MRKQVIVINGKGGAGKDTICDIVSRHYSCANISSITPIKGIAAQFGWDGEKDAKSRRFLSDLKMAFSKYNDLPTKYLLSEYSKFMADATLEILFVHIREAPEILNFCSKVPVPVVRLYIDRPGLGRFDNDSDDKAGDFAYDYVYMNDKPLNALEHDFMRFFNGIVVV